MNGNVIVHYPIREIAEAHIEQITSKQNAFTVVKFPLNTFTDNKKKNK